MMQVMISMDVTVVMAISADPDMIEGCQCRSHNLKRKKKGARNCYEENMMKNKRCNASVLDVT